MAKCALGCYQEWVFPEYHKHWGTTGSVVFRPATMMASSQGESWRLSAQKHERRRRSSAGECLEQPGRAGGGPLDCPSFRCHPSFLFPTVGKPTLHRRVKGELERERRKMLAGQELRDHRCLAVKAVSRNGGPLRDGFEGNQKATQIQLHPWSCLVVRTRSPFRSFCERYPRLPHGSTLDGQGLVFDIFQHAAVSFREPRRKSIRTPSTIKHA